MKKQSSIHYYLCCGGSGMAAALVTDLICYPIDTIKTSIQAARWKVNIWDRLKAGRLFAGAEIAIPSTMPINFVFFFLYETANTFFLKLNAKWKLSHTWIHTATALVAEAVAVTIKNPFEVIKQNRQFAEFSSTISGIKRVISERGFKGFYAGYTALLIREIPFTAIEMPIYEKLLQFFLKKRRSKSNGIGYLPSAVSGAVSGVIAGFITTPIDVIKSRMMTNTLKDFNKGIWYWGTKIFKEEGYRALFKGGAVRALIVAIGGVCFFLTYTQSLKYFGQESLYVAMRK